MKGLKPAIVLGSLFAVLLLPAFVYGASFHTGEQVNLSASEPVVDDVYATGGSVTSASAISGDLYAGGGAVLVTGTVNGDVVVGGGTVTITSPIGDDLRAGGGTVVVQGSVAGDVLIGGGQVHLAGSRIGGDVLVGGGVVRLDSPVGKDVRIGGGEVYINAPIAGDVEIDADSLTLGEKAVISGNLTYRSSKEAVFENGAQVVGKTTFEPRTDHGEGFKVALAAIFSIVAIAFLLALLLGSSLFGLFFHRYTVELVHNAFVSPLLEIGRGLVVLIVTPVVSIFLMVTIIGLPLGVLAMALYMVGLIFSWFVAPILMGSLLYSWLKKNREYEVRFVTILIGVCAYFVIGFVPFVGGLVQCAFMLLALGSAVRLKWHIAKSWR